MMKYFLILILLSFARPLCAQLTYQTLYVDFDSARTYKNLKLIPVRLKGNLPAVIPDILTLQKGIEMGVVTVTERGTASTENVHWLRINNRSSKPLFVGGGEVMVGGRQDRMVSRDTLLIPDGKDQYITAMCVEEGRWSRKEKKFKYGNFANGRLRKVLFQSNNQVVIWRDILEQLDSSRIKTSTLAYNALKSDKKFNFEQEEYLRYFRSALLEHDSAIVGMICVSGNKVLGTEIFAGSQLFRDESIPLLSGYIEDAIVFGSVPLLPDEEVTKVTDRFLTDEVSQVAYCRKNGHIYRYEDFVLHVTAY